MTTNHSPAELAATMHAAYFNDTADALDAYLADCPYDNATLPTRRRLIDALSFDIRDLLHNANLDDLLPFAADLDDAAYDALADSLLTDYSYIPPLADLILADAHA